MDPPHELYRRTTRGELGSVRDGVRALRGEATPASIAWASAIESACWFADPSAAPAPSLARIPTGGGEGEVRAVAAVARAAWLAHDHPTLEACRGRVSVVDTASAPSASTHAALLDAWAFHLAGRYREASERARHAYGEASRIADPSAAVEATATGALATAEVDLDEGLSAARRAWRMARSESLWLAHLVAGIALARVRRLTGTPALALRILDAMTRMATPVWWGACAWEQAMAGAPPAALPGAASASARAAATLSRLLRDAAERGSAALHELDALGSGLRRTCAPWAYDAEGLSSLLFVDAPSADQDLADWRAGVTSSAAPRWAGVIRPSVEIGPGRPDAPCVYVSGELRRRVLGAGVPADVLVLPPEGAAPGRVEACLCALALAGEPGLDKDDLFKKIYGFAFRPDVHDATFRTLRYRARGHLGERAEIRREGDRYALAPKAPFAVVDPRCDHPLEEIMLRFLAASKTPTARAAANGLGMSLRKAQGALKQLVDDGACRVERDGRRILYVVEDTTFTEPTALRAR